METQKNQIREHLLSGRTITPIQALDLYGCFRLSARIYDLRETGMNIKARSRITPTKKRVAEYFVDKEAK